MATTSRKSGIRIVGKNADQDYSVRAHANEFERLYRESYAMVYGRILFRMRDEEAARDVTAEAFLNAARSFEKFDPSKAKFSTWVCTIAHNCMIDHYRKVKIHVPIESVPESTFTDDGDHAQEIANADLAQRLLAVLDEDDREIVHMKFCEELSNSEIAHELGMNPSTVSTRVHRALAKMRAAL